jgi:hypothetical protein
VQVGSSYTYITATDWLAVGEFWLNAKGLDLPDLPRYLSMASGHNGQYVVVFPEQELVVVRLGLSSGEAASGLAPLLEGIVSRLPDGPAPAPLEVALP